MINAHKEAIICRYYRIKYDPLLKTPDFFLCRFQLFFFCGEVILRNTNSQIPCLLRAKQVTGALKGALSTRRPPPPPPPPLQNALLFLSLVTPLNNFQPSRRFIHQFSPATQSGPEPQTPRASAKGGWLQTAHKDARMHGIGARHPRAPQTGWNRRQRAVN